MVKRKQLFERPMSQQVFDKFENAKPSTTPNAKEMGESVGYEDVRT